MKFIIYPLIAIFFMNLLFFILASIFDLQIMEIFANGMKYDFLKYLSIFYHEAGFTELYIAFILAGVIIFEYYIHYANKKKGINKEVYSWMVISLFILVWAVLICLRTYNKWEFNYWIKDIDGNSIHYNLKKMLSAFEYRIILIFVISYQFIILLVILLYSKLVFFKKPGFYQKTYWKISLKVIVYFFIAYGLVGTMKVLMGRDYYNGMESSIKQRISLYEIKTGIVINFSEDMVSSPAGYQPWWTFNGLIGNPGNISWKIGKLFNGNAFPSGHMAQMGVVGACFFYVVDPKDDKNLNWWKIMGIYLFFIHQLMMVITFLINGSHWLSDTTFTWMWTIVVIYLANIIVDKIVEKRLKRIEKTTSKKTVL